MLQQENNSFKFYSQLSLSVLHFFTSVFKKSPSNNQHVEMMEMKHLEMVEMVHLEAVEMKHVEMMEMMHI